jgi:hypothetical protein
VYVAVCWWQKGTYPFTRSTPYRARQRALAGRPYRRPAGKPFPRAQPRVRGPPAPFQPEAGNGSPAGSARHDRNRRTDDTPRLAGCRLSIRFRTFPLSPQNGEVRPKADARFNR